MNASKPASPNDTYGADQHGLICGFVFGPDGIGRSLGGEQALHWLAD